MKVLISTCLLGVACKYSGGDNARPALVAALQAAGHELVPVCPEVYGGLPTPRTPAERIGSRVVERMRQEYGSDPADILAGVGPSICPDCFEVGHNVAEEFIAAYPSLPCVLEQENARPHVDLWMVAFRQFVEAGVLPEHISLFDVCTMTTPRLYSHRRDKGNTGGMAAYLRILP